MSRKPPDDEATRPVKAVARRPSLGLLPAELLTAKQVRFVERKSKGLRANDYEVEVDGSVPMDVESQLHVFRGWRYDFTTNGAARFSIQRSQPMLVLEGLRVVDAAGEDLGALQQELTGLSVHFEVVDGRYVSRTITSPARPAPSSPPARDLGATRQRKGLCADAASPVARVCATSRSALESVAAATTSHWSFVSVSCGARAMGRSTSAMKPGGPPAANSSVMASSRMG